MDAKTDESAGKCPVMHITKTNRDWWPNQLDLQVLHRNSTLSDPMGTTFDYAKEFKTLDLNAVIKVAGRLRPLRWSDDPYGVACRGHVPHRRRPRRRR
jgi:catalase-peroxidase